MHNYYETVARLLVWKECPAWRRDTIYNGIVIHRSRPDPHAIYFPFPLELSSSDHLFIVLKRSKKGGGWKSLPKLLKYLDNKDDPDAWLKKQKLIKELLQNNGGASQIP